MTYRLVYWLVGGWLFGCLVCWLVGWLAGQLDGLFVGWLVGWPVVGVRRSVIISKQDGKLQFHAPVGPLTISNPELTCKI